MKNSFTFLFIILLSINNLFAGDWFPIGQQGAPVAREGHTMVTLPDGRVLLFGGTDAEGGLFNDLYSFENNGWAKIIPKNNKPTPRRDHQAWTRGDAMYIYGGQGENSLLDDMWKYDDTANTWQQVQLSGPRPTARRGHTVTTLTDGTEIIVGGTDSSGNALRDVWRLNTDNTYTQLNDAPLPITEHRAELVVNGNLMLVFGKPGSIGIYRISENIWSLVSGGPPNGKGLQTSRGTNTVGDPVIFIFGGKDINGNELNDVYEYDVYNGQLTQRSDMPQPIVNGASTPAPLNNPQEPRKIKGTQSFNQTTLVFGGVTNGTVTNNTYTFSTQTPPDSVTTIATADTIRADSINFIWNSAQPIQATYYELQVSSDTGMTALLADTLLTDTTITISGLNASTDYWWRVRAFNAGGWGIYNTLHHFYTDFITGVEDNGITIPGKFELFQNYPNPFNPSTTIEYSIPVVETGYIPSVQLKIYDVLGRDVATLVNKEQKPGNYKVNFNASTLASGVYLYRIVATNKVGKFTDVKKLLLLK